MFHFLGLLRITDNDYETITVQQSLFQYKLMTISENKFLSSKEQRNSSNQFPLLIFSHIKTLNTLTYDAPLHYKYVYKQVKFLLLREHSL